MRYDLAHQSSGKNYLWLEPTAHIVYRLLFRKIYLHHPKGVPANKPVLIAANHPTAFIDPIFFCLFFDPPIYNMTRGDIFRKPIFRKLMESVNMFPVFRRRDGYAGRDRNDEVFEYCQEKMRNNCTVNIFVEGEHHLDKRVMPIQKGIARIAFGTYENSPMEELQIVPVGCNYITGDRTRDEMKLVVGSAIFVKDYWPTYQENPNAAVNRLCQDIEVALKSVCYHIEDRADDTLAEQLLTLWRSEHPAALLPVVERHAARFFQEKTLLDRLNEMPKTAKENLRQRSADYFSALAGTGLDDAALLHPEHGSVRWGLFLLLGFPLFLAGQVLSWPVRWFSKRMADTLIKKREFYTSVFFGVALLSGVFYFLALLLTGIFLVSPLLISLALLLPLLTWFALFYWEIGLRWWAARKALRSEERERLLELRGKVRLSI